MPISVPSSANFNLGQNEFDAKLEGANTLGSGSDDDDDGEEANDNNEIRRQNGLSWLMSRLSFVARRLIINKPSTAELITHPVSRHKNL